PLSNDYPLLLKTSTHVRGRYGRDKINKNGDPLSRLSASHWIDTRLR
ncbi:hypothetical protein NPIL_409441, partial [Nephila pilipes]